MGDDALDGFYGLALYTLYALYGARRSTFHLPPSRE